MTNVAREPQAAERVESLDMLRGVLALAVAIYHFSVFTQAFTGGARTAVVIAGIYAVQTFFIISGFCFFHLYAQQRLEWPAWRAFHIKRFMRIAPLYYLAVAFSYFLDPPVYPGFDALKLLENLSLLFGVVHPNHAMVPGGWSIGLEYVFYLALPILVVVTRHTLALYGLTITLMAAAIPYTFWRVAAQTDWDRFHEYVLIPNQAFLFLLGGVIAHLRRRTRLRLPLWMSAAPFAVFAYVVAMQQPPFVDHLDVMVGFARVRYVALCFSTALVLAFVRIPKTPWLVPLRALGERSYSTYLVHPFAWLIVEKTLPTAWSGALRLLLGLLLTLTIAAITYRFVERPANQLGHRWARSAVERHRRSRRDHTHLVADA